LSLIQLGADRIAVDALLHDNPIEVENLSEKLGSQALIASLPLSWNGSGLSWLNYRSKTSIPISDSVINLIKAGVVSEVLISDWTHEGIPGGFEKKLIEEFPLQAAALIAFGGISDPEKMEGLLQLPEVAAVAVGNFLSYREHAIQAYKEVLTGMQLRPACYI
jgi:cyclase